jgi:two-component system, NtrC family, C4-dicarboxylate transport response regulator DctD
MMRFDEAAVACDSAKALMRASGNLDYVLADHASQEAMALKSPQALVVSPDDDIHRKLTEILGHCGFASVLARTVAEGRGALAHHNICLALCVERFADGNYQAVVEFANRFDPNVPVIVVSRTGDWPDYLKAMCAGAFDYLAYPPIPGELRRGIRNALLERQRQQKT